MNHNAYMHYGLQERTIMHSNALWYLLWLPKEPLRRFVFHLLSHKKFACLFAELACVLICGTWHLKWFFGISYLFCNLIAGSDGAGVLSWNIIACQNKMSGTRSKESEIWRYGHYHYDQNLNVSAIKKVSDDRNDCDHTSSVALGWCVFTLSSPMVSLIFVY